MSGPAEVGDREYRFFDENMTAFAEHEPERATRLQALVAAAPAARAGDLRPRRGRAGDGADVHDRGRPRHPAPEPVQHVDRRHARLRRDLREQEPSRADERRPRGRRRPLLGDLVPTQVRHVLDPAAPGPTSSAGDDAPRDDLARHEAGHAGRKYYGKYPRVRGRPRAGGGRRPPTAGCSVCACRASSRRTGRGASGPWSARVAGLHAEVFGAEVGDSVWVEFATGDVDYPIWTGVWYAADATPANLDRNRPTEDQKGDPDAVRQLLYLETRGGSGDSCSRPAPTRTCITMDANGIQARGRRLHDRAHRVDAQAHERHPRSKLGPGAATLDRRQRRAAVRARAAPSTGCRRTSTSGTWARRRRCSRRT